MSASNPIYLWPAQERVVFGQPAGEAVRAEAERLGAQRVFVTSGRSLARLHNGPLQQVERALGARHAGSFTTFSAHTPVDDVLMATAAARAARADLLVAVGGGSVIDGTKAMTIGLWHAGADHTRAMQHLAAVLNGHAPMPDLDASPPAVRCIAVPTTLSAAEFNGSAGVTSSETRTKRGLRHRRLIPSSVVLDPEATCDTPLPLLLATGMRAVDHAIESYLSPKANAMTEVHSLQGLTWLTQALPAICRDPKDVAARGRAQLGAWQAMTGAASGAGTGASHGIGYALGAGYGIAHGHTTCVLLPAVLAWSALTDTENRQRVVARALGASDDTSAARAVARLVRTLHLPGSLQELGITADQLPELAHRAISYDRNAQNARPVTSVDDVMEILEMAWLGQAVETAH
jgi:maleylacetate reductase